MQQLRQTASENTVTVPPTVTVTVSVTVRIHNNNHKTIPPKPPRKRGSVGGCAAGMFKSN